MNSHSLGVVWFKSSFFLSRQAQCRPSVTCNKGFHPEAILLQIWALDINVKKEDNSDAEVWYCFFLLTERKMTGSPGQTRPLKWINMTSSWEKICKLILVQIPVDIWWHWVSRGHYWSVLGETGPVLGGTDRYLIVLGLSENIWFTWSKPSNNWILGK